MSRMQATNPDRPREGSGTTEPREAALEKVERDTADQQERVHRLAERETHRDPQEDTPASKPPSEPAGER